MRLALAAALLLTTALAAPAASQHAGAEPAVTGDPGASTGNVHPATIGFDSVRPARLDILTGESVRWTNTSARTHTVTADDERFDSGRLASSATYTQRFATPGEAPYHCRLHPLIRGVVAAHDVLLDPPGQAAVPNRAYPLFGRTVLPAGTPVLIEADSGAGFAPVAWAEVGSDGRFGVRLEPTTTATYRAVAATVTSPPVNLLVLDRQVALTVRRATRGRYRLHVKVTPASLGGRVVLQLYLPERFGWWPARQAKLGKKSATTFTLYVKRRLRARVHYTLPDGATMLAASQTVHVGPRRSIPKRSGPTAPAPAHGAMD